MIWCVLLAAIVLALQPASLANAAEVLDSRPEIRTGSWVLAFMEGTLCEACESVLPWIHRGQDVFPEFRYVLSYPSPIPAGLQEEALAAELYADDGAVFGRDLGVEEAPTILVFSSGRSIARLDWPFAEADLLRTLATASILNETLLTPSVLVGGLAPAFTAVDLGGTTVSSEHLGLPLLLVFLSPECPSCWGGAGSTCHHPG